jgi:hypothetical protein
MSIHRSSYDQYVSVMAATFDSTVRMDVICHYISKYKLCSLIPSYLWPLFMHALIWNIATLCDPLNRSKCGESDATNYWRDVSSGNETNQSAVILHK